MKRSSRNDNDRTLTFTLIVFTLVGVFTVSQVACSPARISVGEDAPPTFYLSGSNVVKDFELTSDTEVIWRLYPKDRNLTLNQLSVVKYGEVPSTCKQGLPQNETTAPQLVEGKRYFAIATIFDSAAVRIHFMIENGKIVVIEH